MSEVFINEEIEFSLDDEDYFWVGSYEVVTEGDDGDWIDKIIEFTNLKLQ